LFSFDPSGGANGNGSYGLRRNHMVANNSGIGDALNEEAGFKRSGRF